MTVCFGDGGVEFLQCFKGSLTSKVDYCRTSIKCVVKLLRFWDFEEIYNYCILKDCDLGEKLASI